jgi:hypothetical protein
LAGLCFCRDTLAARRSLTTSGPQPEERTGHGPFWGKSSIRPAVANAPDPDGSLRAGAEAAERWRAGRRPAPGESRYIATGTRAMSRHWTGLIALTAASRLSPMATAEGVELASPHLQPGRPPSPAEATERRDPADGSCHSRPHGASGQPGTSRTESLLTTRPRTSIQSGSDQGRATGMTRVWTTGLSERATRSATGTTDIKAHNTAPSAWVL